MPFGGGCPNRLAQPACSEAASGWATSAGWRPDRLGGASATVGNAIDAAATLDLLARDGEAELLLQGARHDTAHGMDLPAGRLRHLHDAGALGPAQEPDQLLLLCARTRAASARAPLSPRRAGRLAGGRT